MNNKILIESGIRVPNSETQQSFSKVEDSIKSINVRIEAARSGRINGNLAMYTPKAMTEGMHSFLYPFKKHLQSDHYGEAIGVISEAEYAIEFFPKASKDFLKLVNTINKASAESNGKLLVSSIKQLIRTPEYNSPEYKGLGTANIYGDIYDLDLIKKLKNRDSKTGKVSIGGKSSEVYCSVCAERLVDDDHIHAKGEYYNGELCFYIHNDLYLDHCGFVANPADKLTKTEIVNDEESSLLNLDVINYTKNSTENLMNLLKLKELAKDATSVKTLIEQQFTDESKANIAKEKYEASLKGARATSYLLTGDKVLNLRTPVGIYLAESLVNQFDDADEDKEALKDVIDKAKTVLDIENLDTSLEEFLVQSPSKVEVVTDSQQETPKDSEKTEEDKQPENPIETVTGPEGFSVTDAQQIIDKISEFVATKFEELTTTFTSKVEDTQKSSLKDELNSLRVNLEAGESVISDLQSEYSNSLIELIRIKKGGTISDEYVQKLKTRSIDQLKLTLEDLKENLNEQNDSKVVDPNLVPVSQSEAVETAETTKTPAEEEKPSEEDQKVDENSTQTVEVQDSQKEDPQVWFSNRIAEVGLAQASREYKTKFNN